MSSARIFVERLHDAYELFPLPLVEPPEALRAPFFAAAFSVGATVLSPEFPPLRRVELRVARDDVVSSSFADVSDLLRYKRLICNEQMA